MIENIQYKYEGNAELVMLSRSFLEKYVYTHSNDSIPIDEDVDSTNVQINNGSNNLQMNSFNI